MSYNKQTAINLADDLVETAKQIAESVRKRADDDQLWDDTCERLGRAITELKTSIRN